MMNSWLKANWPAPEWLQAGTTLRSGGFSEGKYHSLNLASHVDDDQTHVEQNRQRLIQHLNLPAEPKWLNQVHGNRIVDAETIQHPVGSDGIYTDMSGIVVAVLTADCLPLLICDVERRKVAAVHIGWRGFCSGIIEQALEHFSESVNSTMFWIGPCISQPYYEIDQPVYQACIGKDPGLAQCFSANRPNHWLMDLSQLVEVTIKQHDYKNIYHANCCSYRDADRWFSYRRDGITGRMASLIWMETEE